MLTAITQALLFPAEIHIFVGSSSVLMKERRIIENVIRQLQEQTYTALNVQLRPIFWENESRDASVPPEDAIALGLRRPSACEVCLFMFSNWFGSPGTIEGQRYESGTIWEFEDACKRPNKQLRVFRKDMTGTTLAIGSINDKRAAEQWIRMVDYFNAQFHEPDGTFRAHYEVFAEKDLVPEKDGEQTPFEKMIVRDLKGAIDRAVHFEIAWLATQVYQYLTTSKERELSERIVREKFGLTAEQTQAIARALREHGKITTFPDDRGMWRCRKAQ